MKIYYRVVMVQGYFFIFSENQNFMGSTFFDFLDFLTASDGTLTYIYIYRFEIEANFQ